MKHMRKIGAILLTLVMMLSMTVTAFAAEETGSITIKDSANVSVAGKTFKAYKILNVESFTEATEEAEGTVVYTVPDRMNNGDGVFWLFGSTGTEKAEKHRPIFAGGAKWLYKKSPFRYNRVVQALL